MDTRWEQKSTTRALSWVMEKRGKAAARGEDGVMAAVAADDKLVNPHCAWETEDERAERLRLVKIGKMTYRKEYNLRSWLSCPSHATSGGRIHQELAEDLAPCGRPHCAFCN
jgi:hypothetical protein